MLKKLFRVLGLLKNIRLGAPRRSKILILDEEGSTYIRNMILQDRDSTVLPCITRTVYVSPRILLAMVANFNKALHLQSGRIKIYWVALYYLGVISCVKPHIVVSYIDNCGDFQLVGQLYQKAKWFFIQNGIRWSWLLKPPFLPHYPDKRSRIVMDNLFCYGEHDIALYNSYNHAIKNFFPVGSILGSWYLFHNKPQEPSRGKYDICVVSQWVSSVMQEDSTDPSLRLAVERLEDFIKRYVQQNQLSLVIAMRSDEEIEYQHYCEMFGTDVDIVRNVPGGLSTYYMMDASELTLVVTSTAGHEAFAWGKKVLFCNFSGDTKWTSPVGNEWSFHEYDYALFTKRLDAFLSYDERQYFDDSKEMRQFFINYSKERPTYDAIRSKILSALN